MTSSQFTYGAIANEAEAKRLQAIISQCFIIPLKEEELYHNSVGKENFRILRQGQDVAGGLAILQMSEWFGEQPVSMGGIAGVGIAPEYRGSGAGLALMQNVLKELRDRQISISTLYSAAQPLYRKVGYEQAGEFCTWEIPTNAIKLQNPKVPSEQIQPLAVQLLNLAESDTLTLLKKLYDQQAQKINGFLMRHPLLWENILNEQEGKVYSYIFGEFTQPQGYVIFTQKRTEKGTIMQIRDWVLLTTASIQQFWQFMIAHRSQIDHVHWRQSSSEHLTLGLAEPTAKLWRSERWMLRILDVESALTQRGYNPTLEAELHLEISEDDLFLDNNDKFILRVANGRSEVTRGGRGDLQVTIRSFASLYTGLFSPNQLQLIGQLSGTDQALHTAAQIFLGNLPWRPDFF